MSKPHIEENEENKVVVSITIIFSSIDFQGRLSGDTPSSNPKVVQSSSTLLHRKEKAIKDIFSNIQVSLDEFIEMSK